jgi:hypothetical protein
MAQYGRRQTVLHEREQASAFLQPFLKHGYTRKHGEYAILRIPAERTRIFLHKYMPVYSTESKQTAPCLLGM